MIVAGEASGEKHGAALAASLKALAGDSQVELFGAGGEEMRAAGVDTVVDIRELAIIGVPEIIRSLNRFYDAYKVLVQAAKSRNPDVVVLIDWPDFNLRLAKRLKREGFRIVYYISPQVWAWRKYRIHAIRRLVDKMLVILPFEEEFYRSNGIEVEYVGHPLADSVKSSKTREEFFSTAGLDLNRRTIALLPGSRRKEVHYHMPAMVDAASRIASLSAASVEAGADVSRIQTESDSSFQFIVPVASTLDIDYVRSFIDPSSLDFIRVVTGEAYNALAYAEAAVVASGTATVEAALLGTPMVIIYRGSEINWRLIRPLIHLDTFGMVNLIARRRVATELIQHDVTGAGIARELLALISSEQKRQKMKNELARIARALGGMDRPASDIAAERVLSMAGIGW